MNSGIFTARFAAVEFSIAIAGVLLPSASMCVRYRRVYTEGDFDEKTSQRPFGEKLCHEFITGRLLRRGRSTPPPTGTIYSLLSGRINRPVLLRTKTIHLPSGETLGKSLLMPFSDAPTIRSGGPPLPSLNGMRYRSYCIWVSFGSLANAEAFCPGE